MIVHKNAKAALSGVRVNVKKNKFNKGASDIFVYRVNIPVSGNGKYQKNGRNLYLTFILLPY